jgi:phenylalanyl-tRNA synthetase beta chain
VGHFGEVRREVRDEYDLADSVYTAEFDLDALRELAVEDVQYQQVSRYPSVRRDIAFLLPREMDSKRAETVIGEAAGAELESLMLFDAFEGKPLPAGKRNLAFSLSFRSADQTLTDEEVEAAMARVRDALRTELGAEIRE